MTGRVLVFIPCYNCEAQIPRVLKQLEAPEVQAIVDGVLCVDNRSTDGTREAAQAGLAKLGYAETALLHNDDNYGLGGSHKVAINFAMVNGYDYLVVLHGDDQGAIADLVPHIAAGRHKDLDFLMGARFMKGSKLEGYSLLRTAANHTFNLIFSAISGQRLFDLGSGLNLFKVEAFKSGFHLKYADDLTFNYYLILGVVRNRFRLGFFPLTWREDDQISNAKLSKMGFQLLRIVSFRLFKPAAFFATDHRQTPRAAYPSTRIA